MAVTTGITLLDKVLNLCLCELCRNVLVQHSLNLLRRYNVSVALVKYTEALLSLFITPGLILSVSNHVLAECEIDAVALLEIGIALP